MMEFKLKHGVILKKVVDAVKDLVPHANFNCTSSYFSMQATDLTNLALVSFLLKSDTFTANQNCCSDDDDDDGDDGNVCLGMNLDSLSNMLKLACKDDSVTIMASHDGDYVKLVYESPNQKNYAICNMPLMDIDCENLGIPEAEYDAVVTMPSSAFLNTCRFLSNLGETAVQISVTSEGLRFSANSLDEEVAHVLHLQNTEKAEEATIIEMKTPVSLTFGLRYLISFAKATSLSSTVTINLSSDMPLLVEYKIAEIGYIRFHLAPKIEEVVDNLH